MQSTLPTGVTLALQAVFWLVVFLRRALSDQSRADRQFTIGLALAIVACALREPTLQPLLVRATGGWAAPALLLQLSWVCIIFCCAILYLIALGWLGRTGNARAAYAIAAGTGAATLIFGTPARMHGLPVQDYQGASVFLYWLSFNVLPAGSSVVIIAAALGELRRLWRAHSGSWPPARELVAPVGLMVLFGATLLQNIGIVGIALMAASGIHNAVTRASANPDLIVYYTVLGCALGIIRPVTMLLERAGLDRWSRQRARLLPLWSDLTAACPEIVHLAAPPEANRSRYQLHRTIIEIRDGILILSRWATACPPAVAAATAQAAHNNGLDPAALQRTVRLARACAAKADGARAAGDIRAQQSMAQDLLDETDELTRLAALWPAARRIAVEAADPVRY